MQNLAPVLARPAGLGVAAGWQQLRLWLAERRRITQVENELYAHSTRELADLGLSRADIPAVARGQIRR